MMPSLPRTGWQPEQDAAPGGGSEAASTGRLHATTVAIPMATRNAFISGSPDKGAAASGEAAARCCQANVMFWSFSGTERMRFPVAAK